MTLQGDDVPRRTVGRKQRKTDWMQMQIANFEREVKEMKVTFDPHNAFLFIFFRHLKLVNDFCNVLGSHIAHLYRKKMKKQI